MWNISWIFFLQKLLVLCFKNNFTRINHCKFIHHTSHLKPFLSNLPCVVRRTYFSIIFYVKKCALYLIKYGTCHRFKNNCFGGKKQVFGWKNERFSFKKPVLWVKNPVFGWKNKRLRNQFLGEKNKFLALKPVFLEKPVDSSEFFCSCFRKGRSRLGTIAIFHSLSSGFHYKTSTSRNQQ